MGKLELRLNPKKVGNYAFFCPVTRLHLTLANPVGYTDRISNYILRAIKGGTIIDVNKMINMETGEIKASVNDKKMDDSFQQSEEQIQEITNVDEKKKKGKRAQSNPIDEAII